MKHILKNYGNWYDPNEPDYYDTINRWDYGCLEADEKKMLDEKTYPLLFTWYQENGILNIGYEDDTMDAPVGYHEVVDMAEAVAKRLQEEDYFKSRCNKRIPIIIQDYEYADCVVEATRNANIHGEADDYLKLI